MARSRRPAPKPRILSAKEAAEEARHYEDWLAQRVIEPVITPAMTKRWKRIREVGASAEAGDLQTYFYELCKSFGRAIAVDLLEHILDVDRTKYWTPKRRGRPEGAVDDDRDELVKKMFDGNNKGSLLSQARRGELMIEGGKLRLAKPKNKRKITQEQLINCTYKGFGFSSAAAMARRLKELRKK